MRLEALDNLKMSRDWNPRPSGLKKEHGTKLGRKSSYGMVGRVAFMRADVSLEHIASIIRVRRISELGTLAVTSNRSTLRR
jgi:hypothetical protein